ncbi:hypothetical protein HXW73_03800 [Halomonas sp. SH5A2]|nr:hypothetical protein [Halomonas sp. SH5A2]QNI02128.1 hypothetical protein HXW73_03800 [Halomonas sp. SH5A2]
MSQPDKKDDKSPKPEDEHYDEANPMPDTHHVNPKPDDSPQNPGKDKK